MGRIELFSNTVGEREWYAVRDVLRSRWLGMGQECAAFERELAAHFGVERLLLTNCCTSALYLALDTLGLAAGDEVIVPTVQFVASANAVLQAGATPVFADCDRRWLTMPASEIDRLVTRRTVGVVLLHYGGHPHPEMGAILEACAHYGLWLVEDAANGPASTWQGRAIGTLGDAGVWSFDSMKLLVMGDGGALWLKDEAGHKRAGQCRNLGMNNLSGTDSLGKRERWWEFDIVQPWGRADSNDLLACIGRIQLGRLAGFVARRREVWAQYQEALAGVGDLMLPPEPSEGDAGSYYLYWLQTERRDALARHLIENGVYCTFRYHPLHKALHRPGCFPGAEYVSARTLNIPLHQNLTDGDVAQIVDVIREFYWS